MSRLSVKEICAADTVHDFCKSTPNASLNLQGNALFAKYISQELLQHLGKFNVQVNNNQINNVNTIENKVLEELNIHDNVHNIPTLNYHNFEEEYAQQILDPNHRDFPFAIEVDDMTDVKFKQLLGSMCSTVYQGSPKIEFMTDTSLLKADTICSISINPINPIRGKLIASEASYYDDILTKVDDTCTIFKSVPMKLRKDQGNLFGLHEIAVGSDITLGNNPNDMYFMYTHNEDIPATKIKIDDFRKQQLIGQRETGYRNKNFFKSVINEFDKHVSKKQRTGGGKRSRVYEELPGIMNILNNIYKLDYNNFKESTEKILQFVGILLDFKRAGDQLQIKSALHNHNVFVSNDIISSAYAYYCGVPCIKTSPIGTTNDVREHRTRRLVFYNFKTSVIKESVLDNRKYYKDSMLYHLGKLGKFVKHCQSLQLQCNTWIIQQDRQQGYLSFLMRRFRYPYIYAKLQNIIDKSNFIFNMQTMPKTRRTNDIDIVSEMESQNSRVYQHNFILQYNILICMIMKCLLTMSFAGEYSEDGILFSQNFFQNLRVEDIDEQTLEHLKQQLQIYDNEFLVKMAHFFEFNDYNQNFILNVFQYYFSNNAEILHENFTADMFTEKYLNDYVAAIKKIPCQLNDDIDIGIPIISDYIKILKYHQKKWQKYPLIFFAALPDRSTINTQDGIVCKSILLSNARQDWHEIHNHLLESFDEYHVLLTKLSMNTGENPSVMNNFQTGRGSPVTTSVSKSKSKSKSKSIIIDNIRKDLFCKRITPYDIFVKELKQETDIPEIPIGDDVHLEKIYPGVDKQQAYTQFCKDMYEILAVFIVKTLHIFDEHGYIRSLSQSVQSIQLSPNDSSYISARSVSMSVERSVPMEKKMRSVSMSEDKNLQSPSRKENINQMHASQSSPMEKKMRSVSMSKDKKLQLLSRKENINQMHASQSSPMEKKMRSVSMSKDKKLQLLSRKENINQMHASQSSPMSVDRKSARLVHMSKIEE
jgi:hypothetical protein